MTNHLTPLRIRLTLVCILACVPGLALVHGGNQQSSVARAPSKDEPAKSAWTAEEALAQLGDYPRDPYLQYVALQLARRNKNDLPTMQSIEQLLLQEGRREQRPDRLGNVDLFSIFTGALAVQESLQLDSMRGAPSGGRPLDPLLEKKKKEVVDIAKLKGPTIKSHPWEKMLGTKKPAIDPLAKMVPDNFSFVQFRSLTKLLDLSDSGDLWSIHLSHQLSRDARTQQVGARIRKQLVIETNKLLQPLYDGVVEEVALTGSDLFLAEGSDVTLVFRLRQPKLFKERMDGFLTRLMRDRKDARRTEGEYLGVPYVHVTTPEREQHVFSAYPDENVHIRSNSKPAFFRVLAAIKGKTPEGKVVTRLGETAEFAYIRTLMPRGAREEDGFVYLSDPFIRHLVGPQLKLAERRRMLCYNHLRMIGHAALLYRTEQGKVPASLEALARAECCPEPFNEGDLRCYDGGTYSLSADGMHGVCSHHGPAHHLTPCCENPLAWVSGMEADDYRRFLQEYEQYWRTYFDPIAIRIAVTPERYRLETIVLPLINNSIYQGLAFTLGGQPEALDALPVPKRNIFSLQGRLNKDVLLKQEFVRNAIQAENQMRRDLARTLRLSEKEIEAVDVEQLIRKGLGNQIGLHLYDSPPMFDLNTPEFLSMMLSSLNGTGRLGMSELFLSFLITSLNAPVYLAIPVQDAKIVDTVLEQLDKVLPRAARQREQFGFIRFEQEFYTAKLKNDAPMRCYSFSVGPVKWRLFWARIGGSLYIASKALVLDDLVALEAERSKSTEKPRPEPDTTGHALVRLRAKNWNEVLADYQLGWAENNRQACLHNLGPLASIGRALAADRGRQPGSDLSKDAHQLADRLLAAHLFCPENGKYVLSADGKKCSCSVHGTARAPRQQREPNQTAGLGQMLQQFKGLTASLTFLEDGLHAVIVIDRK